MMSVFSAIKMSDRAGFLLGRTTISQGSDFGGSAAPTADHEGSEAEEPQQVSPVVGL